MAMEALCLGENHGAFSSLTTPFEVMAFVAPLVLRRQALSE